ncbi:MAG TPA: class I poly(R)-hydroxyalkanoic acid synthase [Rhizomicrobium sp.]|jgi:polyhydroxyalkanoate synthase|nr:class I poly(R)-hydroxyalkanoic acid synthase [Rhizomicrobium sp.]
MDETAGKADYKIADPAEFARNMMQVGQQSQRLLADFIKRQTQKGAGAGPFDPLNLTGTFSALLKSMAANPTVVLEAQFQLWKDYMNLWERTAHRMLGGESKPVVSPAAGDRRFKDRDWEENQVFDFIKQSYLLTANWMQETVAKVDGDLDEKTRKRIEFYTKQFADAIAPTNFVLTNPEVLRTTMQSNGENLVKGLNNLLEDLDRGEGQLSIRQSADAFRIGENIATAPGKVVFRNDLIELLQFDPTTETVYETPLLIFPPWINKFYILDLRPENSFIRWAVSRGYTVFVASWVNPDRRLAQKTFEDYMREGIFAGIEAVSAATGVEKVNTIGYCIGGTLLSATLAYMAATKDERVNSATFFAAQADFSEAGDLQVFIDDEQLESMKQTMEAAGGVLEGRKMGTTFNMLRANDLIWSFVVSNYLLGKEPAPFDLLYWNSDTTRMPEATHLFYLREFYKNNALSQGKMSFGNVKLDLRKVKVPVYLQSAKEDHIAPFRSVYKSTRLFGGPVRFIIAGSGHIAGVINPPSAKKYQYWTNDAIGMQPDGKVLGPYPAAVEEWQKGTAEHPGSWWPDWDAWLSRLSGGQVPARKPGDGKLKVLGDAPGEYVKVKAG